jgi:SAM-dependent methyltransferase
MHAANRRFWQRAKAMYPRYFDNPEACVVEFGSYNINGTIRDEFASGNYTGVDWIPGPCVDVVSLAHDAPFEAETFDLVVSASMLEHDPYWQKSLAKMVSVLKPDGLMALSWGGGRNGEHCNETAPDGKFHALKAGLVLRELATLGVCVHFFAYERPEGYETRRLDEPGVMYFVGEVTLIGFKDPAQANGRPWIDPVQEWDAIAP